MGQLILGPRLNARALERIIDQCHIEACYWHWSQITGDAISVNQPVIRDQIQLLWLGQSPLLTIGSGLSCSSQRGCMCLTPVITPDPRSNTCYRHLLFLDRSPDCRGIGSGIRRAFARLIYILVLLRQSFCHALNSNIITSKTFAQHLSKTANHLHFSVFLVFPFIL